jgi:hypothetical protein
MLKGRLVARLLPGLAVSGVLVASFIASPIGSIFGSLSGYGYGICGYGLNSYTGASVVSNVSPNQGPTSGGTTVFITGSGYCNSVHSVTFGGTPATSINVLADTLIQAVSPAHAAGTVDVVVTNGAGASTITPADQFTFVTPVPSVYTALTPKRIWDTRSSGGPLGQGGYLTLSIGGIYVPANATAVVLNVTAVDETTAGFFTVFPTGSTAPTASNLNWLPGETIPNLVAVPLSPYGDVTLFNGLGSADAVVDLEGYFAPPAGASTAGELVSLVPARITDTRNVSGNINAGKTLAAGATLNIQVTGAGGVPGSGVSAVVLNVTAVDQTTAGFFTVFPQGAALPTASNLNWTAGVTVPNRVIVPVGPTGMVSVFNGLGSADVVVDVNGYFTDSTLPGTLFTPLFPTRIKDTRIGSGGAGPVAGPSTTTVQVSGVGGVPLTAKAVILNVTSVDATAESDFIVYPGDATQPVASDLNFLAGETVPNLVVVKLSATGTIKIYNPFGSVDIVIDVVGSFA